jgi:predicted RNA methylase
MPTPSLDSFRDQASAAAAQGIDYDAWRESAQMGDMGTRCEREDWAQHADMAHLMVDNNQMSHRAMSHAVWAAENADFDLANKALMFALQHAHAQDIEPIWQPREYCMTTHDVATNQVMELVERCQCHADCYEAIQPDPDTIAQYMGKRPQRPQRTRAQAPRGAHETQQAFDRASDGITTELNDIDALTATATPNNAPFSIRIPLRSNDAYQWHLGCHFVDTDGAKCASWQLLLPAGTACYHMTTRDGVFIQDEASDRWATSDIMGMRDEIVQHERTRLGLAEGNAEWNRRVTSDGTIGGPNVRHEADTDSAMRDVAPARTAKRTSRTSSVERTVSGQAVKTSAVSDIAKHVLEHQVTIAADHLVITAQLPPDHYRQVNDALKHLGFTWHKKTGTHRYTGRSTPAEAIANALAQGKVVNEQATRQAFMTPDGLADSMVAHAMSYLAKPIDQCTILEPSGGSGQLIAAAIRAGATPALITTCEMDPDARRELARFGCTVMPDADFLASTPPTVDCVLMNPPFSRNQDIDHVTKARACLNDDGVLVAITSRSWEAGSQKKQADFRDAIAGATLLHEDIPAGAFAESGTGVATTLLVLRRDT